MFSEPESLVTRRRAVLLAGALLFGGLALGLGHPVLAQERAVMAPAPAVDSPPSTADRPNQREIAIFAGGCFWGIEGVFSHIKGVVQAEAGYAGGTSTKRITYEQVSEGNTGFAESVRVTFDPQVISYGQLLRIFFSVGADPTTLNYQGPDHGPQYRSALFPLNPEQDRIARAYLTQMASSGVWKDKIVTRVERNNNFHVAEIYHQNFMEKNPKNRYIEYNDAPKLAALKRLFPKNYTARSAI